MADFNYFDSFLWYALVVLLLNITPGQDMMYVISRSISSGVKAGIISSLGISAGIIFHTCLAAFGISMIIYNSIILFNIIKFAGAAYLIYLAIQQCRNKTWEIKHSIESEKKLFVQGALTNIFNPKVGIFFIALLPQFINPEIEIFWLQVVVLGLYFILSGTVVNLLVAFIAGKTGEKMAHNIIWKKIISRISACFLLFLGIRLFLQKK